MVSMHYALGRLLLENLHSTVRGIHRHSRFQMTISEQELTITEEFGETVEYLLAKFPTTPTGPDDATLSDEEVLCIEVIEEFSFLDLSDYESLFPEFIAEYTNRRGHEADVMERGLDAGLLVVE